MKPNDKDKYSAAPFTEFLKGRLADKRLAPPQLEKITGISSAHLEALVEGKFAALPAAPYVRGYLKQIALILELEADELWELYRAESDAQMSGAADRLPGNRFAFSGKKSKRVLGVIIALVLAGVYLVMNRGQLLGEPPLLITGDNETIVTADTTEITFRGSIDPRDTLLINEALIEIKPPGEFEESYPLEFGVNTFTFRVKRFLGQEKTVSRRVVRPAATSTLTGAATNP